MNIIDLSTIVFVSHTRVFLIVLHMLFDKIMCVISSLLICLLHVTCLLMRMLLFVIENDCLIYSSYALYNATYGFL